MEQIFLTILRMSLSACPVILAVLLVRLLLTGAPKKWSYLLWSVVGFRLICPVSFRAAFSLFSAAPMQIQQMQPLQPMTPVNPVPVVEPAAAAPIQITAPAITESAVRLWPTLGIVIWCLGMAVLVIYSLVRVLRLRSLLLDAVIIEPGVWQSDRITTPFLMGLIHPKIYIPTGTDPETTRYVLAHERVHLSRGDHWIKLLAFLILTVHWFNPLCWLAFLLMNRDMELSCDERVLSEHGGITRAYSLSLLHFAAGRRFPGPGMLAFGEPDVKRRIQNVLHWRQPKRWATILAALLCVAAMAACAANPIDDAAQEDANAERTAVQRLMDLQAADIQELVSRFSSSDPAYNDTLAAAIRNAAGKAVQASDEETISMPWYWAELYLSNNSDGGISHETIYFQEELTAPVVYAQYENPETKESARLRIEDETLYWLIRNNFTLTERVELSALALYWDPIHSRAADTVQRSDFLTGYDITSFYKMDTLANDVHTYDVYYWCAAYEVTDPYRFPFAGGAGLDSQGRVIGLNDEECYFIVREDGASFFMSFETPFLYADDESIRARCLELIQNAEQQALSQGINHP